LVKRQVAQQQRQQRDHRRHQMHDQTVDRRVTLRPLRGVGEQKKKRQERETDGQQSAEAAQRAISAEFAPAPDNHHRNQPPQQIPARLQEQAAEGTA